MSLAQKLKANKNMAYFSNGTEWSVFYDQCDRCKYGLHPCPIALVQNVFNYEAVSNRVATEILDYLVEDDGTCTMFEMCKSDFFIDPDQLKLNL